MKTLETIREGGWVDRRVSNDGHTRLSEPSLVSPEEAGRGVNNIKNRPLFQYGRFALTAAQSGRNRK